MARRTHEGFADRSGSFIRRDGERVTFVLTSAEVMPGCRLCAEGRCEQRVEQGRGEERLLIIHGPPRRLH